MIDGISLKEIDCFLNKSKAVLIFKFFDYFSPSGAQN